MKLEKTLMKQVSQRLAIWQLSGSVIWYSRLNSGRVKTYFGSWIKMCDTGTPDWLCLVRGDDYRIKALFIECKSTTGRASTHQLKFMKKYNNVDDVEVIILNDIEFLDYWMDKYSIDRVKDIKL